MTRIVLRTAATLLAASAFFAPAPAYAWGWNPFAKSTDDAAKAAAGKAAMPQKAETKGKVKEAAQLKQVARSASRADRAAAQRSPTVNGKPLWSPVSDRYRWNAAKQPSPARRAVTGTVNTLTLKPLRDKLSGKSTNHNPWTKTPPVTNTSANKRPGMLGSLFKPKPKPKTGPQTVSEWIAQDRPGF